MFGVKPSGNGLFGRPTNSSDKDAKQSSAGGMFGAQPSDGLFGSASETIDKEERKSTATVMSEVKPSDNG